MIPSARPTNRSARSILFVVTGLGVGGAERQVVDLSVVLADRGHRVHVTSMIPPGPLGAELETAGIAVSSLGMTRGRPSLSAIRRLSRLVKATNADVVHSHMVHANLLARAAIGRRARPVRVDTAHNVIEGGSWHDRLQRLTRGRSDWMTTVSTAAFERYARLGLLDPSRASVIPNGVRIQAPETTDTPSRVASASFDWACAARLVEAKSLQHLIGAAAILRERGHDFTVSIAGDGPLRDDLASQIEQLDLGNHVRMLGLIDGVFDLLRSSHGFVLSSTVEGLPISLLEAAVVGLPIITTDAGGCAEAVVAGVSGLIVRAGSPTALADAMESVMQLPERERKLWAAAGQKHVRDHFDIEHIADQWLELYERLTTPVA